MKLESVSVKNYRSISTAYKLPVKDYSVLVGPNNEGKSNILKAIALSFVAISSGRSIRRGRTTLYRYDYTGSSDFDFNWNRDFPIQHQDSKPDGRSEFTLEFALDDQELKDFKKQTKVNLSTNLKIKLSIGKSDVKIDFLMKGKGKKTLSDNKEKIAQFVGERVVMRYIPAIRTSDLSRELVSNLLEKELYRLRQDEEYKNLIQQFIELQQPILDKISEDVTKTVSRFIPDVKEIKVNNNISLGRLFRASCTVEVDDGIRTDIKLKGDGVISLTAISLFRYISEQGSADQKIILLVEEPESHLHPNATHGLRTILKDISKQNQVVISTHSPIMIDRENVKHNILVQGGKAVNAKKLSEIRDSLGINLSDNLAGAYLVLLVEGSEDVVILRKLLSAIVRGKNDA